MVYDDNSAVIIDPADRCPYLLSKLSENSLSLSCILLTHAHFDHILAADILRRQTNAPMYIHRCDEGGLKDPDVSYMRQLGRVNEGFCADVLLNDGDGIPCLGTSVRALHTPGHTPGSACYVIGKDVFCGDLVFKDGFGRCDLHGGDEGALITSVLKLRAFFEENGTDYTLRPGHGDKLTGEEFMRKTNHFIYFKR